MLLSAAKHWWNTACCAHVSGGTVNTNYFWVLFQNPGLVAATGAWQGTVAGSRTGYTKRHK